MNKIVIGNFMFTVVKTQGNMMLLSWIDSVAQVYKERWISFADAKIGSV